MKARTRTTWWVAFAGVLLAPLSCSLLSDFSGLAENVDLVDAGDADGRDVDGEDAPFADADASDSPSVTDAPNDACDFDALRGPPGLPVEIHQSPGNVWGLYIDDGRLYWTVHNYLDGGALGAAVYAASACCEGDDCGELLLTIPDKPELTDLAFDSEWVYFGERGCAGCPTSRILRLHKTSGEVQVLAENQSSPTGLTVNQSYVFWCGRETEAGKSGYVRGTLKSAGTIDGGPPQPSTLADGLDPPSTLMLDPFSGPLLWASNGNGAISKCMPEVLSGGGLGECYNVIPLSSGTVRSDAGVTAQISRIAVDNTNVYWREGEMSGGVWVTGAVRRMSKTGDDGVVLAEGSVARTPRWLVLDDHNGLIYWTVGIAGEIYRTSKAAGGGADVVNTELLPDVHALALDGNTLYASTYLGGVYRISL